MGTKLKPGAFDCYDAAEDDEPMFVLLARDEAAPERVEEWARKRFERLALEHTSIRYPEREMYAEKMRVTMILRKIAEALQCARSMQEWRDRKATRVPVGDMRGMGE